MTVIQKNHVIGKIFGKFPTGQSEIVVKRKGPFKTERYALHVPTLLAKPVVKQISQFHKDEQLSAAQYFTQNILKDAPNISRDVFERINTLLREHSISTLYDETTSIASILRAKPNISPELIVALSNSLREATDSNDKARFFISSERSIEAFKTALKKAGIAQELGAHYSDEILRRIRLRGSLTLKLDGKNYVVYVENKIEMRNKTTEKNFLLECASYIIAAKPGITPDQLGTDLRLIIQSTGILPKEILNGLSITPSYERINVHDSGTFTQGSTDMRFEVALDRCLLIEAVANIAGKERQVLIKGIISPFLHDQSENPILAFDPLDNRVYKITSIDNGIVNIGGTAKLQGTELDLRPTEFAERLQAHLRS